MVFLWFLSRASAHFRDFTSADPLSANGRLGASGKRVLVVFLLLNVVKLAILEEMFDAKEL